MRKDIILKVSLFWIVLYSEGRWSVVSFIIIRESTVLTRILIQVFITAIYYATYYNESDHGLVQFGEVVWCGVVTVLILQRFSPIQPGAQAVAKVTRSYCAMKSLPAIYKK